MIESDTSAANWIDSLAASDDAEDRYNLIERFARAGGIELARKLHAEVFRWLYVDLSKAERVGEAAAYLAAHSNDPLSRGLCLRVAGHLRFAAGEHGQALKNYHSALSLLESAGDETEIGRTLISGTQTLIYLGKYSDALEWAARARDIFERTGDTLRLARLDSNIGNIHYRQDRYAEAMEAYQRACGPLQTLGEPRDYAAVLSNIAVCLISVGDFVEALSRYQEVRAYCELHGMNLLVADADYNIAYLHYLRGDYARAMALYEKARVRCRDARDEYHLALCDLDESEMYLELNLSGEGARLARAAAERFEKLGMAYENAKALVNQAAALSRRDDFESSLQLFRRARRRFAREHNHVWPALVDLYQALVLERSGAFEESRQVCQKAYRFLSKSLLPGKAVLCELLQARLELEQGHAAAARDIVLRAGQRIDEGGMQSLRFHVRFLEGEVAVALGEYAEAIRAYEAARLEIDEIQSGLWSEELKIAFLDDKLAVWENLVWLYLNHHDGTDERERVFLLIEQVKSRILANLMLGNESPLESAGESGSLDRILQIRQGINVYYKQIEAALAEDSKSASRRVAAIRRLASQQEGELVRALDRLGPQLGRDSLPESIDRLRQYVPAHTLFVQYYCARGIVHACVLSAGDLKVIALGQIAPVREALCLLQFQISKFSLGLAARGGSWNFTGGPLLDDSLNSHLRALHEKLIAPILDHLTEKHLVIAPHGLLHRVPFHALTDGRRFLIDDFSVSYAPSATVYAHCRARPRTFAQKSLVMGVPDERTPFLAEEATHAAAALPNASLFLGPQATEEKLRENSATSRFIHIATHGLFRAENPMFSSLRLGDTWLNLLDLYHLSLAAELVTLSGCSTGMNVVAGGDEIRGLTRGLLYAGACAVLVTLWEVNDRSTADFMALFYAELFQHQDKGVALRQAMLRHRARYPHPFHWAPFVLVGDQMAS